MDLAHTVGRKAHLCTDLLRCGVAAQVLQQGALNAHQLVDGFYHVHRDADGTGLVCDGAGDSLTNPPGGIGGELEALGVVELLDGADKAQVALLDEVQEEHAAAYVALGDRDHQAQVGADELLLGFKAHLLDAREAPLLGTGKVDLASMEGLELLGSLCTSFDLHGQVHLVGSGEQVYLADLFEVHAHRVAGKHDGGRICTALLGTALALGGTGLAQGDFDIVIV